MLWCSPAGRSITAVSSLTACTTAVFLRNTWVVTPCRVARYTAELEAATSSQIAAQDGTGPNLSDKSLSKSFEVLCVYLAGTKKKYLYIARGVHSGWGTGPAGGGGRRSSTAVRRRRTVSSSLCSRAETFSALLALPVCARQRNWTV